MLGDDDGGKDEFRRSGCASTVVGGGEERRARRPDLRGSGSLLLAAFFGKETGFTGDLSEETGPPKQLFLVKRPL